jgi:hypothetical protein
MRFYQQPHGFYCGIDLHATSMYLCILDQGNGKGERKRRERKRGTEKGTEKVSGPFLALLSQPLRPALFPLRRHSPMTPSPRRGLPQHGRFAPA